MSKKIRPNVRQVRCRAHHLHWVRGLLIAKLRRDIKWIEMAKIIGCTPRWIDYIIHQGKMGGRTFVTKLIRMAREHDVIIHLSDFYDDDPNQAAEKTWQLWKDYTT